MILRGVLYLDAVEVLTVIYNTVVRVALTAGTITRRSRLMAVLIKRYSAKAPLLRVFIA